MIGQYKINGKILIIPVVGNGMANLTLGKKRNRLQFTCQYFAKILLKPWSSVSFQIMLNSIWKWRQKLRIEKANNMYRFPMWNCTLIQHGMLKKMFYYERSIKMSTTNILKFLAFGCISGICSMATSSLVKRQINFWMRIGWMSSMSWGLYWIKRLVIYVKV